MGCSSSKVSDDVVKPVVPEAVSKPPTANGSSGVASTALPPEDTHRGSGSRADASGAVCGGALPSTLRADQRGPAADVQVSPTSRNPPPPGAAPVPVPPAGMPGAEEEVPDRYYKRERRVSVSAESMDPNKVKLETHAKTNAQKEEIKRYILQSENFLFKGLTEIRAEMVASAMFEKRLKAGETVIKQGEDGDNFYLVSQGSLEVFVQRDASSEPVKVMSCGPGSTFGELALMYMCPRAATVKASTDCFLWSLDRVQFRALVVDEQAQSKSQYEEFLEEVEVLQTLNKYERINLADAFESEIFEKDEVIIEQGDEDCQFLYIVEEGTCAALLTQEDGRPPVQVREYKRGDYFGELALLQGGPRRASVRCTSEECALLLKVSVDAFERLLGPVQEVMRRNAEQYTELEASKISSISNSRRPSVTFEGVRPLEESGSIAASATAAQAASEREHAAVEFDALAAAAPDLGVRRRSVEEAAIRSAAEEELRQRHDAKHFLEGLYSKVDEVPSSPSGTLGPKKEGEDEPMFAPNPTIPVRKSAEDIMAEEVTALQAATAPYEQLHHKAALERRNTRDKIPEPVLEQLTDQAGPG